MSKFFSFVILAAIAAFGVLIFMQMNKDSGLLGDVHEHADFKLYIDNVPFNFSKEKYISSDNNSLSNFVHLHDIQGDVIHKHASGITIGFFLETLGMKLNSTCFVLDDGTGYCNDDGKKLRMYVNGKPSNKYGNYEFKDLDRILVTYGNEEEGIINRQIESVTDKSCIQSGKCPERGIPINESSCLTEGGCDVEV